MYMKFGHPLIIIMHLFIQQQKQCNTHNTQKQLHGSLVFQTYLRLFTSILKCVNFPMGFCQCKYRTYPHTLCYLTKNPFESFAIITEINRNKLLSHFTSFVRLATWLGVSFYISLTKSETEIRLIDHVVTVLRYEISSKQSLSYYYSNNK